MLSANCARRSPSSKIQRGILVARRVRCLPACVPRYATALCFPPEVTPTLASTLCPPSDQDRRAPAPVVISLRELSKRRGAARSADGGTTQCESRYAQAPGAPTIRISPGIAREGGSASGRPGRGVGHCGRTAARYRTSGGTASRASRDPRLGVERRLIRRRGSGAPHSRAPGADPEDTPMARSARTSWPPIRCRST